VRIVVVVVVAELALMEQVARFVSIDDALLAIMLDDGW